MQITKTITHSLFIITGMLRDSLHRCLAVFVWGGTAVSAVAQEQLAGDDFYEDIADWQTMEGMTGDWMGIRNVLEDHGIVFFGGYTMDIFGNTTGGIRTGGNYAGLLDFGLELDLENSLGWEGAKIHTSWLWLSGRDASEDMVGNFLTISNIAGFNTLRLFELWFEQDLFDEKLSIRLGQLAADSDFVISDYGSLFINGTFGWPAFVSMNLPEGGPGYPMGTPGIRVAFQPLEGFTFLSAAFQGNVFAQDMNRHGFRYRLDVSDGFTFFNEAQLRWNHSGEAVRLPGQFKTGTWFQSGRFANPLSASTASGNFGFYAIIDQMLFRAPGKTRNDLLPARSNGKHAEAPEPGLQNEQGLGFFGRIAGNPGDRNIVDFYFDTGFAYHGLIPGRDSDNAGVAFGYAQISTVQRSALAAGGSVPARAEMVLEATYQAQITDWLIVQPDAQFIINPNASRDTGNAFLVGGRLTVVF